MLQALTAKSQLFLRYLWVISDREERWIVQIPPSGRNTQGRRAMKLPVKSRIVSTAIIPADTAAPMPPSSDLAHPGDDKL